MNDDKNEALIPISDESIQDKQADDAAEAQKALVEFLAAKLAEAQAGRLNFAFILVGTHTHPAELEGAGEHDQDSFLSGPRCAIAAAIETALEDPRLSPAMFRGIQHWQENQIGGVLRAIAGAAARRSDPARARYSDQDGTPNVPHPIGPDRGKAD